MGPPNEPPTAEQTAEPLHCPLCDYNLHGLPEPRCPECGYSFDWDELRIAIREKKSWFFEHAQRRLVGTWITTLGAACVPWWFWRELSAGSALRAKRLVGWLVPLVFLVLLATAGRVMLVAYLLTDAGTTNVSYDKWAGRIWTGWSVPKANFDLSIWFNGITAVLQDGVRSGVYAGPLMCLATVPLTWAALNVFATTLRRTGVRQLHIWRCAIYTCSVGTFVYCIIAFAPLSFDQWQYRSSDFQIVVDWLASVFIGDLAQLLRLTLTVCVTTTCLSFATRSYLRIKHPISTAVLSQVLVSLTVLAIGMAVRTFVW